MDIAHITIHIINVIIVQLLKHIQEYNHLYLYGLRNSFPQLVHCVDVYAHVYYMHDQGNKKENPGEAVILGLGRTGGESHQRIQAYEKGEPEG